MFWVSLTGAMLVLGSSPAAARTPPVLQDCNAVVTIHNKTTSAIHYVYISNTGTDNWGSDWLGEDVIMPDGTMRFNVRDRSGATRFDVKVKYRDGRQYTLSNFNACAVSHIDSGPGLSIAY